MGKVSPKRVIKGVVSGGLSELRKPEDLILGPTGAAAASASDAVVAELTPDIPELPAVPTAKDKSVEVASDKSRKDRRKRKGRASTILTGKNASGGLGGGKSPRAGGGSQLLG